LYRQLLMDTSLFKKVLNLRTLLGIPPLIDLEGMQPPANADAKKYADLKSNAPVYHVFKNWTKEELGALRDGAWNLSRILEILRLFENFKSGAGKLCSEDQDRLEAELSQKIKMTGYKCISNGQLQIDWDVLAKHFVPSRSGAECKIRWFVEEDPRINKSDWTTEETKKLLEVAQKHSCRNWIQICKDLGTYRTPMQCFQRYQRSHNASIIKQEFSLDEDERLLELVPKYGFNWEQIAMHMPGRTASQCNHRYNNSAIQSIRSGRWSIEEDVRLILAKKAFDKWTYIADYVPGRTGMKCRERFANVLDPLSHRSKNRHWTEDEDKRLFHFVREYGAGNWSKIAELMGDRTDNQCYRRWKNTAPKYCPVELDEYKKKLNLKRKLVLNNFVGRKQNRPKIDLEALEEVLHSKSSYDREINDDDQSTDASHSSVLDVE
jgi:myb proto-oncogene protein